MHESQWDQLMSQAVDDMPQIVEDFLEAFNEIGLYGDSAVPESEIRSTAHEVLTLLLRATTSDEEKSKLKEHAERFGHRRARQGIDLPLLVDAIHLDFKIIWNYLRKVVDEEHILVLIEHVEKLNYVITEYTFYVRASFQREEARTAQDFRIANSRYLDRLFASDSLGERGLSEIAHVLGIEESTQCEVAVFHHSIADEAHAALDSATASGKVFCQSYGTSYVAFWQTGEESVEKIIEEISLFSGIRFDTVTGLEEVRRTVRSSTVVFNSYGRPKQLEPITNVMWAVAGKSLLSVYGRRIQNVTEYVNDLRSVDDPIVSTVEAYLHTGSIKQTAQLSFCHRNTVINRIKQFAAKSGLDITIPEQAALAIVAFSFHD